MRISKISSYNNYKLTFKQNSPVNFSIYDDDNERPDIFEYLHKNIEYNTMPYYNIQNEKPDMCTMQRLTTIPNQVYDKKMEGIKIANFRKFAPNRYSGATLVKHPDYLVQMKNAGIERVIDLVGFPDYEQVCNDAGLEYVAVPELNSEIDLWAHPALNEKDLYIKDTFKRMRKDPNIKLTPEERYRLVSNEYDEKVDAFKKQLIIFIDTMKKGNLYVGCGFGTNRTSNVLKLDYYFNPEAQHFQKASPSEACASSLEKLYYILTQEDKQALGFTDEFEDQLCQKIHARRLRS